MRDGHRRDGAVRRRRTQGLPRRPIGCCTSSPIPSVRNHAATETRATADGHGRPRACEPALGGSSTSCSPQQHQAGCGEGRRPPGGMADAEGYVERVAPEFVSRPVLVQKVRGTVPQHPSPYQTSGEARCRSQRAGYDVVGRRQRDGGLDRPLAQPGLAGCKRPDRARARPVALTGEGVSAPLMSMALNELASRRLPPRFRRHPDRPAPCEGAHRRPDPGADRAQLARRAASSWWRLRAWATRWK